MHIPNYSLRYLIFLSNFFFYLFLNTSNHRLKLEKILHSEFLIFVDILSFTIKQSFIKSFESFWFCLYPSNFFRYSRFYIRGMLISPFSFRIGLIFLDFIAGLRKKDFMEFWDFPEGIKAIWAHLLPSFNHFK